MFHVCFQPFNAKGGSSPCKRGRLETYEHPQLLGYHSCTTTNALPSCSMCGGGLLSLVAMKAYHLLNLSRVFCAHQNHSLIVHHSFSVHYRTCEQSLLLSAGC